jgi:hypothetical protein
VETGIKYKKFVASDRTADDEFGSAISISKNYILVGAPEEDEDALGGNTLFDAGSAYFFKSSTPLDIHENNFGPSFTIYPNPTSQQLNIDLGKKYRDVIVTTSNLLGQVTFTQNYKSIEKIELAVKGPPGIYLVHILTSAGKSATLKIVKE